MLGGEIAHKAAWIVSSIGAGAWGYREVANENLLSETIGLAGSQLSFAYLVIGVAGVLSLYHYYESNMMD